MLRSQYGVATSSSVTPTASHAEDAQPNEVIYKRRHGLPPQIGSTWKNNYRGSGIQRGGYRGLSTEYGMRGNVSQRRRGNFQPNRGHQPSHISNSGRNVGSVISQSVYEGSSTVHPPHSAEPLVQVKTVISSTVPNILAETSSVKNEPRTPSPSTSRIERTLITSSCKFYPIPEFCKKTFPEFKENRDAFFREKMQELTRLGLTKVKSFFRDDGLAIEWKSKVPVWSDTLLPEFPDLASAIKRAHQMNHQTSSPKRKRQSAERHSRDSNHNNNDIVPNESKLLRLSFENPRIQDGAGEDELSFEKSPSPTPMSFFDRSDHPLTTVLPLLSKKTPELICLDPEVIPPHLGDPEPDASIIPPQNTSAMDVDTPTPIPPPKPVRRMLFKPMLPGRRNQPKVSTVQTSTLPTSNSAEPVSTSLTVADGHSRKDELEVPSRQEKPTPPRPRLPLPSKKCTPTSLPPRHHLNVEKVEGPKRRDSLSKDGNATDTDTDADLVVDLLLRGTVEEPQDSNCLSSPLQQEVAQDSPLYTGHNDKEDKDVELSVSAVKDTGAVVGLATQFLQKYLQLFDVDRLKLEAAYAKNALFSCRIHHVQEPSFSMAGLFAPENYRSRQGFNASLSHASISAIEKGRAQIVNRLLELGPHRFCPRGVPRTVDYNVVPLSSASGGGILLTVHGEVVNPHLAGPQMDHILSVDQNFILRQREMEEDEEDVFGQTIMSSTGAGSLWPLVAVSHQMTVRDAAPLHLEKSDSLISRIQGS